ncbi:carbohydrate porin [Aporhodopirellula aestuarii]|uniref:Carbohydrate porin n=1 Tax=Aporhodopirellula aestuarii TaxID=2950107 RepID=A0ABT0TXZ4_9BACT|nr:carbohydrate porin [Aporhodopirellula aestuarii]MCM2369462.1 carbohydrate porin [Aporhodopirellula aestuarii]
MESRFQALIFSFTVLLAVAPEFAVADQPCDAQLCGDYSACDSIGCDGGCDECRLKTLLGGCAEKGVVFSGDLVQYYQAVTDGGLRQQGRYGGLATYGALFDFGKLGLTQGTFLQIRGQSQFGESINGDTGSLLIASNTNGTLPTADGQDTALTDFLLTQFLSERFAVFAGRLNTFDGTLNAFAHGRGKTQFMNIALATNPIAFRTSPYVTYGAGFTVLGKEGTPVFSFSVIDPNDYATRGDLDELYSDGVTIASETRLPTQLMGRPGHVLLGGTWSNREVLDLSQIARLPVSTAQPLPRASSSWSVYGNFDHYLTTYDKAGTQGWGVFGRWGIADDDTNPVEWFLSAGIGGNSPICGRRQDSFGLGWYYSATTDAIPGLIFSDDAQGVEAFYSVALTEKVFLSPDVQWARSANGTVDDAWAMGLRLFMTL